MDGDAHASDDEAPALKPLSSGMRFFRLMLLALVVLGVVGAGAGWYLTGREAGPSITIKSPDKYLGRAGRLDVVADAATPVVAMSATLEQNGQSTMVASYAADGTLRNQVALSGALGKTAQPALVNGPATLTVKATRQVFFGLRTVDSSVTRELQVRLDPPRIAGTSNTPDIKVDISSPEGLLKGFLTINGDLRKKNSDTITALAAKSQPKMLWTEAFAQMGNSQVESRFADRRTYFFDDKEIDRQVHLGFDLASVQQAPVHASNAGVVVFADFLGICPRPGTRGLDRKDTAPTYLLNAVGSRPVLCLAGIPTHPHPR